MSDKKGKKKGKKGEKKKKGRRTYVIRTNKVLIVFGWFGGGGFVVLHLPFINLLRNAFFSFGTILQSYKPRRRCMVRWYRVFHENGFFSVHSINEHYLSIREYTQVAEGTVFRKPMVYYSIILYKLLLN